MGCECCKESNPKDYQKCQSKMDAIKSRKPTSSKNFVAPCGNTYYFGAKFTLPKKKKKKRKHG